MFSLVVRPMYEGETSMVLSDWKKELVEQRRTQAWSSGLLVSDMWRLLNHVLDDLTLPSCEVVVGCHANDVDVPLCWAATRDGDVLMSYVRRGFRKDPELSYRLEREFSKRLPATKTGAVFNPFKELEKR